jgi:pSer/pThr/pTyr-binding forkhead associated (FHA) protein
MNEETKSDQTYFIGRRDRRRGPRLGPDARREDRVGTEIWIPHDTVSSRHAEINLLRGRYYLRDLGSTNGTFLLDQKGTRNPFKEGYVEINQRVCFGEFCTTIEQLLRGV